MTKCIAMILAEGRSDKLGALTSYSSKPAVYFGGKKRIIDFTVSNCINSGIETIGILSQYHSAELHRHIDKSYSGKGLYMLPACLTGKTYNGMADAVYKNMGFIERYEPDYVLILQGDHIYKMNYKKMIEDHIKSGADATVAVRRILPSQSSTFGCVEMGTNGLVADIRKMPQQMDLERIMTGVYVFNWGTLRKNLILDAYYEESLHDFYGDILPFMLLTRQTINTYESNGYWREVSTIESMWEANMEVLDLKSIRTRLLASDQYISGEIDYFNKKPSIHHSIMREGCQIAGKVEHSVIGASVIVKPGAEIVNSVIMSGVVIGNNTKIYNAIIGKGSLIMDNTTIGVDYGVDFFVDPRLCTGNISVVEPGLIVPKEMIFCSGSHIDKDTLNVWSDLNEVGA